LGTSDNILSQFRFGVFRFVIRAAEPLHLPRYKGSTFRGGLGRFFREAVCINPKQDCRECILHKSCAYSYCFETPADDSGNVRYSNWPHPYVLEPPLEGNGEFQRGERMELQLVLIGRGLGYLPFFILVIELLGKNGIGKGRGRYILEQVVSGDGTTVYSGDRRSSLAPFPVCAFRELSDRYVGVNPENVTVRFLTPARIKHHGHFIDEINFKVLITNLTRRMSLLSLYHCGEEFNASAIIGKSRDIKTSMSDLHWHDWERYSSRQETRMSLGGFIGQVKFEGELGEFLPYLKLGEYLHVGKQTSFGLGKYIIDVGV
jgi:hypothetical protein